MSEAATKSAVLLALGARPGLRLFNNPVGQGWQGELLRHAGGTVMLGHARAVRYGLCPGSSDLVGWRSHTVTAADVGRALAVFTALEIKAPGGQHPVTPEQRAFLDAVTAAGGIAGVARSPEDAAGIVG